jgi:pimeloyl-ACP methyl ester carboxylesterase
MLVQFNQPADSSREVAIIFVHGFTGDAAATWGEIPDLLSKYPTLSGWDLYGFGYQSERRIDLLHIWSSDARLEEISTELISLPQLNRYRRVALVAHSMGGLVVQRALVRSPDLRNRASHIIFFGTPSAGLGKAAPFAFLNQQIKEMNASGRFIAQLRKDWTALNLNDNPPFSFLTVAGEIDQFVPPSSSLYPFPEDVRAVIPGNHISMLRTDVQTPPPIVSLLLEQITRGARPSGPRNSAALAVERGDFQQAIDKLWPIRVELDSGGAALLALALDSLNRRDDAIAILQKHNTDTDSLGILGGRYKRRWLVEHRQSDFDRAIDLYSQAYKLAGSKNPCDSGQCFYHGINLAYLNLATRHLQEAQTIAEQVLNHCAANGKVNQRDVFWQLATQADAHTMLGGKQQSLAMHSEASKLEMTPWQALSIQEQAVRIADLAGWSSAEQERLAGLY